MCSNFKCGCNYSLVAKVLLVIGGINWGLVGAGMLAHGNWNLVNLLLGSMPTVEAIVYVVVGLAALLYVFGCKCGKCKSCVCDGCGPKDTTPATPSASI